MPAARLCREPTSPCRILRRALCLRRLPPSEGTWYIPNLNPGTYQLKIEATGFKTYVQNGIVLRTAEQPRLDVKLEVGEVTQSVEVTGTAATAGNRDGSQRSGA